MLIEGVDDLDVTLEQAGVDPEAYDPAKPRDDLTGEQLRAIERAAAELLNPRTGEALEAVDQQARDVCRTALYQ